MVTKAKHRTDCGWPGCDDPINRGDAIRPRGVRPHGDSMIVIEIVWVHAEHLEPGLW